MDRTLNLSGKVALVTGASRGIGRACADILAAHQASLVLNSAHDTEALHQLAAQLKKNYNTTCWVLEADAGDAKAVTQLYKDVVTKAKRLDILVANAGIMEDALLGMISPEQIHRTLNVNVAGVINHLQMASRLMRRNEGQGGSIIAMSSIIGRSGNAGQTLYAASKAAVIGAVLSAAKELAPFHIRVNALTPGFIDTAMTAGLSTDKKAENLARIGMQRIGQPDDVARAALFLASDLSQYITGQVLGVDGGMSI